MTRPRVRRKRTQELLHVPPASLQPQMHPLLLRAEGGVEIQCHMFAAADDSVVCGILHEPTRTAEVDDLPRNWPFECAEACDSAQLQCGHVFHAPALAVHFLVGDMRCPVCRDGVAQRMMLECVPEEIRPAYAAKVERARTEDLDPTEIDDLRRDIRHVLANLEVVFSVLGDASGAPPRTTARTRILWSADHLQSIELQVLSSSGQTTEFGVQRSFQRLVRGVVSRQLEHNSAGRVRFSLQHPLVPVTIASNEIIIADVWNGFFNTLQDNEAAAGNEQDATARCQPVPIQLYCAAVAGTNPVGIIKAEYHQASAAPVITTQLNTLMLVNIASYVRQVLESIRDAVEQHTSFDADVDFEVSGNAINGVVFPVV